MIYVGIDDTDTIDTRGTNQLAKAMARAVADEYFCQRIVRHQLLDDPRVPCTSKNGCASLVFTRRGAAAGLRTLIATLLDVMIHDFIPGSDPGLCVATKSRPELTAFARRCQRELVTQAETREVAARCGVFLEGLGGTNDGVIGALAAVGLAAANDDGRVVQWQDWPDDLSGPHPVEVVRRRGIDVRELHSGRPVHSGRVDVGKHLRPNWRDGRCVLFVTSEGGSSQGMTPESEVHWNAVKLP